ncbi:hypothetical protein KKC1_12560 [Calderihabitans maritimus]|uniref:Uncharacterized protein n=1 Tax=Calderihabitans maritimus TaxID=1246530 RepID=A0A1Z5HRV3_9FIRM|nr:hypothetical protein KKC1_12560 [Calderihabitans maritimus]
MTVAKNICFGLKRLSRTQERRRLEEVLELVGMRDSRRAAAARSSGPSSPAEPSLIEMQKNRKH